MISKKKNVALFILCFSLLSMNAQGEIKPVDGFSPQIGIMVDMLQEIKDRIAQNVRELDQQQTDYLFDEDANSIGAMIMHLAATESYYLVETLGERQWTAEEEAFWKAAGGLGQASRDVYKGKPIAYYLDLWDQVRGKTLIALKTKDDSWFATNIDEGINYHWIWFHVLEHQAAHMGQIDLVKKRLPK